MTDFAAVTDPSNPFNTEGLSREVLALIQYVIDGAQAMNIDAVVTSTTDHPVNTSAGYPSRHRLQGTDGEGLAIDCRLRRRGLDIHDAVFAMFRPVALDCHELIYANAAKNVKAGRWVEPYATSGHHDHVHISVNRGVFLRWHVPAPSAAGAHTPIYGIEWPMSIFKDDADAQRAFIRTLYLTHLHREPESAEAVEWWRAELAAKGADRVIAQIADSPEAAGYRDRYTKLLGV